MALDPQTSEPPARGARLPRSARRAQLLVAAQEVFVENGYHAAAMDEIADRAGVSKPVLYQHFPGKLDLYLAILDRHIDELLVAVRRGLDSTHDNKLRVAATIGAYFAFVDREDAPFRLVFESDLTNDSAVRERVDRLERLCAEAIADVIGEDTGLPREESELLGMALTGMAQVTARYWLQSGRGIPRSEAERLTAQLSWRGLGGFPKHEAQGSAADPAAGW
ncbi:MAG: TetR/AcrR family transcriptional regulator [Actinomycetes bacterium]